MVNRHDVEIISLRQAAVRVPALTLQPAGKLHLPLYSGERSTLPNFLKLFRTWTKGHGTDSALITDESIHVVDKERRELDARHGKESVNKAIAVWSGLVKAIEKDKTLLDMIITTGSPSEAWKISRLLTDHFFQFGSLLVEV